MLKCNAELRYAGARHWAQVVVLDHSEFAVWLVSFVRLGFRVVDIKIVEAGKTVTVDPDAPIPESPPDETWAGFAIWCAMREVQRQRAITRWQLRNQVCDDRDPPYGDNR